MNEYPTRESCLDNWQRQLWDAAYKKGFQDAVDYIDNHFKNLGDDGK